MCYTKVSEKGCTFAPAMHFISELRYNPKTQCDEFYYRIKESFRDLTGRCRSRIMLNIGFIEESHRPEDIRDIGKCLDYTHKNGLKRIDFLVILTCQIIFIHIII